jgi:tRNA (guanine26-N2/guanine27-N2)-dimethyltransferase
MLKKPGLTIINEGKTSIFVFTTDPNGKKGPGKKQGITFYNPAMMMNRDISILVVQQLINTNKKQVKILDGMAASGIRGFRFKNELTGKNHLTINDCAEDAFQLIKKNAQKYDSESLILSQENIHVLFSKYKYDYIDIDPFGSPAVFIDGALRSIKNNGIIAVTATDTATLCGVYPMVCIRRYNARPLHGVCMHETALRILIGFIGSQAGKHELGIHSLLSYSTDHYLRCYVKVKQGVKQANKMMENIYQIPSTKIQYQNKKESIVGPLWMGDIHDKQFVSSLMQNISGKQLQTKKQIQNLFSLCEQEAKMPAFYFSTTELSRQWKKSPPPIDKVIKSIQKNGFFVTKTQFDPTGFKTNASKEIVDNIFLDLL